MGYRTTRSRTQTYYFAQEDLKKLLTDVGDKITRFTDVVTDEEMKKLHYCMTKLDGDGISTVLTDVIKSNFPFERLCPEFSNKLQVAFIRFNDRMLSKAISDARNLLGTELNQSIDSIKPEEEFMTPLSFVCPPITGDSYLADIRSNIYTLYTELYSNKIKRSGMFVEIRSSNITRIKGYFDKVEKYLEALKKAKADNLKGGRIPNSVYENLRNREKISKVPDRVMNAVFNVKVRKLYIRYLAKLKCDDDTFEPNRIFLSRLMSTRGWDLTFGSGFRSISIAYKWINKGAVIDTSEIICSISMAAAQELTLRFNTLATDIEMKKQNLIPDINGICHVLSFYRPGGLGNAYGLNSVVDPWKAAAAIYQKSRLPRVITPEAKKLFMEAKVDFV